MKYAKKLTALFLAAILLASCGRTVPAETETGAPVNEPAETEPAENAGGTETEGGETDAPIPENPGTEPPAEGNNGADNPGENKAEAVSAAVSKPVTVVTASSYHDVWEKLNERGFAYGVRNGWYEDAVEEEAVEAPAPAPEPAMAVQSADADMAVNFADEKSAAAGADYSETNTQIKGIDEADIVKTDGEYIYALYDGELRVYSAAGAETALLSRTQISTESGGYYID